MTREEAISHIGDVINIENNSIKPIVIFEQEKEALYMAIEALQNLSKPNNELKGSDLISRESVLAEFRDGRDVYDIVESIEELPSAPDSRQRGEWVDNHNGTFVCDQCGCKHSKSNFCPNCGADMRGEDE